MGKYNKNIETKEYCTGPTKNQTPYMLTIRKLYTLSRHNKTQQKGIHKQNDTQRGNKYNE